MGNTPVDTPTVLSDRTINRMPFCTLDKVLIVIPTLNEQAHIHACITALLDQSGAGLIVVADGGSTDNTAAIVREIAHQFPQVKLLHNPDQIQSAAINLAVQKYANDSVKILIRCDAHATYPDDFIAQILNDFSDPKIASVVVPMDAQGQGGFAKAAAWIVDSILGNGGSKHRGGNFTGFVDHGHHAGMRMDWFQCIGGYDISFDHNEDAEYDLRLKSAGGQIWMNGAIQIGYVMRPNLAGLTRQYFNYGRGRARTLVKHAKTPRLRQSIPTFNLVLIIVSTILSMVWTVFAILPLGYLSALLLVSLYGVLRLRDFAGLWAGPAVGAMHNAWAIGFLRQCIWGDKHGR